MKTAKYIIIIATIGLALASCASQDFAGDGAVRQTPKKPINQDPPPNTNGDPNNPNIPTNSTNGPLTDSGTQAEFPGVPVTKVGLGFEDRTDMDFNDIYLCFAGNFNVNGRDIVSNRDQTVQATWGNIAAIAHKATITISDSTGKQLFQQTYQGISRRQNMGTIPLTFTKGSKLHVQITNPNIDHTNAVRARVDLDKCNNTGG